jgi:hypothetical protein
MRAGSNKPARAFVQSDVMKTIPTLLLGTLFAFAVLPAQANPYDRGYRDHDRYDHGDRGYRGHDRRDHGPSRRDRVRAQWRLRQLGFYFGPVDGDIGYGTRRAIMRFQRHRGLPVTGWLDWRTLRALRVY